MKDKSSIGNSIPRLESANKVTGKLTYLEDLKIKGMLHTKLLRSPLPHAKIVEINLLRAQKLSGVVEILTGDTLSESASWESHYGPVMRDQGIVAVDKVRYVGDIVAAVAATQPNIAEEAVELIDVEYQELPSVYESEEALDEAAPILHEKLQMAAEGMPDLPVHLEGGTNLCNHVRVEKGDIERGFSESDQIFEEIFTTPSTQHITLEPFSAAAYKASNGQMTVWSTVQNPFIIRQQIAEIFHLPLSRVRIISLNLGGGYGSKMYVKLEPIVGVLTCMTGRPVGITLTREETFQTITKHAAKIYIKTGTKNDGTILARRCRIYLNTGAYAEIGPRVAQKAAYGAAGPYLIPNLKIDANLVYTNCIPAGAFRGFGLSQSAWAYESQMDTIARSLKIDPLKLREKNLLDEGGEFVTGEIIRSFGMKESLKKATTAIQWGEKNSHNGSSSRGKGLACIIKGTLTPSISSATIRLNEDGSATVYIGTVDMGQGSDTVMAQIVSQELAIPIDQIEILHSDTDSSLFDFITASSRSTFHMGKAVQLASQEIKKQLSSMASAIFETAPEKVSFSNQSVHTQRKKGECPLSYRDLLLKHFGIKGGNLLGRGMIKTRKVNNKGELQSSSFWVPAVAIAEVEVNKETGSVQLLRYVTATDVGKVLNPQLCQQQVRGAAIMGIGQALLEEIVNENGLTINPNLLDYNLPRFLDIPDIETILVEHPNPNGPHGAKGVGETAIIPAPSAIANAVEDAVGVRIRDLPITPEKILSALSQKESEQPH